MLFYIFVPTFALYFEENRAPFAEKHNLFRLYQLARFFVKRGRVKVVEHSAYKSSFVANKYPRHSKNMFFDERKLPCTLPDSISSSPSAKPFTHPQSDPRSGGAETKRSLLPIRKAEERRQKGVYREEDTAYN